MQCHKTILFQIPYNIYISAALLIIIASISYINNIFFLHYSGYNYFPPHVFFVGIILCLILFGCVLLFGTQHYFSLVARELLLFYFMLALITYITTAAQYTPFKPIDNYLIKIDQYFNFNLLSAMLWTKKHDYCYKILNWAYNSLALQMLCLPLFIIITGNWQKIHRHYFLMLISACIGFVIYYFFPTTAPASNFTDLIFNNIQHSTGVRFTAVHHNLPLSMFDVGLVSLPSFHAIWSCLSIYLIKDNILLSIIFIPINILLIISCVLLGWHYLIDIIVSITIIAIIIHI